MESKSCIEEITGLITRQAAIDAGLIYPEQPLIVRCKDCKHSHIENNVLVCPFGLPGGELFYCAYGAERRPD